MKEIWKDIEGYENLYQISNLGRVKSFKTNKPKYMTPQPDSRGYLQIGLIKDKKRKNFKIHRLVANAFINRLEDKDFVNHINEDKQDNRAENLEWVAVVENNNHGTRNERLSNTLKNRKLPEGQILKALETKKRNGTLCNKGLKVRCVEEDIVFNKIKEAADYYNIRGCEISACCKGKRKTCGGYHWEYV